MTRHTSNHLQFEAERETRLLHRTQTCILWLEAHNPRTPLRAMPTPASDMPSSQASSSLPPTTQIWLMDGWRIVQQGKTIDIPTGQPRALLTYLLLQPGHTALRSTLVEELFPDSTPERGRRYLSDALYRLRRALDPAPIIADAEHIELDMTHAWWVDVWAFFDASSATDAEARAASLALYSPALAPEITDHWILVQRVRLQERFLQTALEVAATAEAAHDHARAEAVYRRSLAVDPLLESAHRGLMRTLAHTGQLAAALEHYDELVDTLEREVATPPSAETRLLADQLFQELDLARRRAETRTTRRLVGRVVERSRLLTALDNARAGQAGVVILLGEAGIGKSALLRDLAHAADWRGWQIHWGISHDDFSPAPYAPLTSALHDALPAPRAAQLASTLPPIYHDLLARLFPQLHRPSTLPVAAFEPKRLPQALAQLLHALQEIAPLLILLDNVQWGDPALWEMLNELIPLLHQQRTLLVLSAQTAELQAAAASWTLLERWDREGLVQVLALDALEPAALGELATMHRATLTAREVQPALTQTEVHELYAASGGNPLLAMEILTAGTQETRIESRPAIATLVTQRLHRLSPHARQAAGIAAILGSHVAYPLWESLWQAENPYGSDLAAYAAELERADVLQITRSGYTFAHDTLHAAALADMDEQARRRRHAAALTLLENSESTQSANPLPLLYHAQSAADHPATIRYALIAGEQALRAFAFTRAEAHFTLALAQLDAPATTTSDAATAQRYTALLGRIHARHVMAAREGERADLEAINTLPLTRAQQVTVLTRRAEYHIAVSEMAAAQSAAEAALALAGEMEELDAEADEPPSTDSATGLTGSVRRGTQRAALHVIIARSARDRSLRELAHSALTTAHSVYQANGDTWGMAMTTDLLGGLAWDQGDYARAAALHREAADAFATLGDQIREAQSLNNLGSAYWELGRYADARTTHERSIVVCRELGNKLGEGDNIDNLGGVAWAMGDYTLAIRQYRAALDLRESINDLWGVAISLSNLGSAYRMQEAYEQALDYYQRALPLYEDVGRKRGKAYVLEGAGKTLLALGRLDEAWTWLQKALALRIEIGDHTHLVEIRAAMIHAALAREDIAQATLHSDALQTVLTLDDRPTLRQLGYFALYDYANQQGDRDQAAYLLARALQARDEMAAALPESDRARFLQNVPINRDLAQAAQEFQTDETVTLGVGKQAKGIRWTLHHPQDALIEDDTARRRHVLVRLLAQAAAQGVTPTHEQLATSLNVSRRTILRDLAALPDTSAAAPPQETR